MVAKQDKPGFQQQRAMKNLQVMIQIHRLPIQGWKFPVQTAEFAVLCLLLAGASASI